MTALTGCAAVTGREQAASRAVERFETSLREGDGVQACAALAPGTVEELEDTAEADCPAAVADAPPPKAGAVRLVNVYGRQARVVLNGDTVFLSVFPDGWKVTAAGCSPRAGQPYKCIVKGG
ncbi:hypothetical protein AB0D12_33450 [Streptomyces sp. NPDC048479]|uniref:hypothetical protein n=1 Tax=Streptomyces sp. NPDC048479 TaxID=3154725 RepID=UPI00343AD7D1